jgi:hypothetical protein
MSLSQGKSRRENEQEWRNNQAVGGFCKTLGENRFERE